MDQKIWVSAFVHLDELVKYNLYLNMIPATFNKHDFPDLINTAGVIGRPV